VPGAKLLAGVIGLVVAACDGAREAPPYSEARRVVDRHCIGCHSEHPTVPAFPIAPGGVVFDTPADMVKYSERIRIRVAVEQTMPLMNKTGMTDSERSLLAGWVASGARTQNATGSTPQ